MCWLPEADCVGEGWKGELFVVEQEGVGGLVPPLLEPRHPAAAHACGPHKCELTEIWYLLNLMFRSVLLQHMQDYIIRLFEDV